MASASPSVPGGDIQNSKASWARRTPVLRQLLELADRRETIGFLASANLRSGNRDKVLGNLWNLLDPVFFIAVYFLVFGIGLRQAGSDRTEFVIYLTLGLLPFHFLSGVLAQAATCIPAHRAIIHEVYFPKAVLPIALCLSRLYDFLWAMFVTIGLLLLMDVEFSQHVVWLPVILLLQVALCLGLAFVVAYLGAFYADTANVINIAVRLLFFASPIFYFVRSEHGRTGIIPEQYVDLYMLNPLAVLIELYRDALLWGRAPSAEGFVYVGGVAVAALLAGFVLFIRADGKFAKYL